MGLLEAIILGIVEGLTEFLPVSSTGHMIVTSSLLGIQRDEFTKLFEISIQFGAILAVVLLYARKFFEFRRWQFYGKLIIGVIPALVLGYLFSDKIDKLLESPTTVAISMLAGGFVLLFIDNAFSKPTIESDAGDGSGRQPQRRIHHWRDAAKIHPFRCRRVFFFSCRADYVCRNRLFHIYKKMAA
jgi:undecaprenyl-diphosphatase